MRYVIALSILVVAVFALFFLTSDNGEIAGMNADKFASAAFGVTLLVAIGSRYIVNYRGGLGKAAQGAAAWIAIFIGLIAIFAYREEFEEVAGRIMGDVDPGRPAVRKSGEIVISQDKAGEFYVKASINGQSQAFIFDTGASKIVLTAENAKAAGFNIASDDYTVMVHTANGTTLTAPINLKSLTVGPILETNVPALAAKPGDLRENLLGRSFLDRLASYEVRGDRLILRWRGTEGRSASQ